MLQNPDNIRNNNTFVFDYWTPNNPGAKYRSIAAYVATLGENFWHYMPRSFVRLQDVTLTYNVPDPFLRRIKGIKAFKCICECEKPADHYRLGWLGSGSKSRCQSKNIDRTKNCGRLGLRPQWIPGYEELFIGSKLIISKASNREHG